MRLQDQLLLVLGGLDQCVSRAVGLDADKNPNLLGLCKRRMKSVEAADEKVANKAIEETRFIAEQNAEAVAQALARFVRDERQVRRHSKKGILRRETE